MPLGIFLVLIFFLKIGFDISCKLSNLHEMSKSVFWENKQSIINLMSAEFAKRVVKVNCLVKSVIGIH